MSIDTKKHPIALAILLLTLFQGCSKEQGGRVAKFLEGKTEGKTAITQSSDEVEEEVIPFSISRSERLMIRKAEHSPYWQGYSLEVVQRLKPGRWLVKATKEGIDGYFVVESKTIDLSVGPLVLMPKLKLGVAWGRDMTHSATNTSVETISGRQTLRLFSASDANSHINLKLRRDQTGVVEILGLKGTTLTVANDDGIKEFRLSQLHKESKVAIRKWKSLTQGETK